MRSVLIYLPASIQAKFAKYHNLPTQVRYTYTLSGLIFESAKVSAEYFRKCWIHLHPLLSDDELFSLFKDSGFSPRPYAKIGRLAFVTKVLQKYKVALVCFFVLLVSAYTYLLQPCFYAHAFLCICFVYICALVCVRVVYSCLHDSYFLLYEPA